MTGIVLENPKYPFNVGGALRAAAAFGVNQLSWSGIRVTLDNGKHKQRLPREERMRGYIGEVDFAPEPDGLDRMITAGLIPVAVEVLPSSESLVDFTHPEKAVYVFGPEDGSISKATLARCHRFVHIPVHYCLNLAAVVNVVLWDRRLKRIQTGRESRQALLDVLAKPRYELPEPIRKGFNGN